MNSNTKKFASIIFKGTISSTIVTSSTQLIGIILLPVFTFYLTPEDYGIVSIVSMIVLILSHLTNPGILTATNRLFHNTKDINDQKLLIGSANVFFVTAAFVPLVLGLMFGPKLFSWIFNDFPFYPYGFLALLLNFLRQPSRSWITLMNLNYKFHQATIYNGISLIIGIIVSVILVVVFDMGAMGKVLGMFPSALILLFVSIITIYKFTGGIWSFNNIKKQVLFGLPVIGALWSTQILELGGAYLLERFSDMKSVGLFALAMSLAQLPLVLIHGFKQMWNPVLYDNMNNNNYETIRKLINYFVGIITVLNLGVMLFAKEAILIIVNERYYGAIPLVSFLILGVYFNGLLTLSNSILGYKNKFGSISIFAIVGSGLFLILCFFLIPINGALGAAISFGISYFTYFTISVWNQKKSIFKIIKNWNLLIPILLVIIVNIINYNFSIYFYENKLNFIELLLKLIIVVIAFIILFRVKIFLIEDIVSGYNSIIKYLKNKTKK